MKKHPNSKGCFFVECGKTEGQLFRLPSKENKRTVPLAHYLHRHFGALGWCMYEKLAGAMFIIAISTSKLDTIASTLERFICFHPLRFLSLFCLIRTSS